jgi:serine-type D-Ala-D-Ala carboxypeptidase/endopeptidase (penicillin-binding protein 4)
VTAAVAVGYVVHDRRHQGSSAPVASQSPMPLPSTPAPRAPVLAPLDPTASTPTAAGMAANLAVAVKRVTAGAHLVGEVADAQTGAVLWSRLPNQGEAPASTTKVLTAAAALEALGPDHRLETTTRQFGRTVYLVGGGDPTIVASGRSYVSPSYPRPATLAALARRTAAALGATHRIRLRLDATAWYGPGLAIGWKPTYVSEGDITPPSALEVDEGRTDPTNEFAARTTTPVAQAGEVFASLLAQNGITVIGPVRQAQASIAARQIASVSSPTVAALVQRTLTVSDDDLAEALGRAVAIHLGLPPTFSGSADAVKSTIQSLGISTRGVALYDTSGLSHRDRIPPRVLVAVLRAAGSSRHPELAAIYPGLPVAGLTGTLALRYQTKPTLSAAGILRAKTGTLTGVNTLAGSVVDHSGRRLVFAFLASDASAPWLTVPALDYLASRLTRCGCST